VKAIKFFAFATFTCGLLFGYVTVPVSERPEAFYQISKAIKERSIYKFTQEEISKIDTCIFGKYRIASTPKCLKQDEYARYESPKERRKRERGIGLKTAKFSELDSGIGYLKIEGLLKDGLVEKDIKPMLLKFKNAGGTKLIIDLRGNPGGTLFNALDFVELFAPMADAKIIEIKDRKGRGTYPLNYKRGPLADFKTAILIDGDTASVAEMIAGAMKLWGAKLFGKRTFGKGVLQSGFALSDGGVFYLTTMIYYFADGTTPENGGVEPNIRISSRKSFEKAEEYLLGQ